MEFTESDIRKIQENQEYGVDFMKRIEIKIMKEKEREMELEIVGIDSSIANALRRIMLSEIPTMAIEKVDMYMNTSIIPDEILSHRLGLIPIKADPTNFNEKHQDEEYQEHNSLKFKLHVKCKRKKEYQHYKSDQLEELEPEIYLENCNIYANQLEWIAIGNQRTKYSQEEVGPIHKDVLIAKLRENQEIELEVWCEKNIGKVHAKWQAVCPAYYRLMPEVRILKPITQPDLIDQIISKCPMDVFAKQTNINNTQQLVVKNSRSCTMCRECIRDDQTTHQQNQNTIYLGKAKNHYIFTIEAVGMLTPYQIFIQALHILRAKLDSYLNNFQHNIFL